MTRSARHDIAITRPTRRPGRSRFSVLALVVVLSGCTTARTQTMDPLDAAEITFETHAVVTGCAQRQTVLTGFLLDGAVAELGVVRLDAQEVPRLGIYAFSDGNWARKHDIMLRPDVRFVDVANIGGRDRLITYEPGRLHWIDPDLATERALVDVACAYQPPRGSGIPHVDITRDINRDGRDDLVVPNADGFRIFVQEDDGTFAEPVKIGPALEAGVTGGAGGYRFSPWDAGHIHEMDYNRDGRRDLVFWNEDHFEVHLQDQTGRFSPTAQTFTTGVALDSDNPASLVAPQEVRRRRKDHLLTGDMTGRVLHSFTDMNGDGIADLVVFALQGGTSRLWGQSSELWSMHFTYEVHFGTPTPDGTAFASDVGTAIRSDGIPFGIGPHDFDHDGQVDVMFTTITPGIFKAIGMIAGALLTQSVSLDLAFYRMDGVLYPDKPNATRKARAKTAGASGERTRFAPVLIGEVNGDRHADLLVGSRPDELRVYLGVPGPDLFARRPIKVRVAVPSDDHTWLVDLNRDGKQDVLMHHASATRPHRVTLLIAR